MLTVNLHLHNGDIITTTMTPAQRDRVGRTLSRAQLPTDPYEVTVGDSELQIPWRFIGYISARPMPQAESKGQEAAD